MTESSKFFDVVINKLTATFQDSEKYIKKLTERIELLESDLHKRNATLINVSFKNMVLKSKESMFMELIEQANNYD